MTAVLASGLILVACGEGGAAAPPDDSGGPSMTQQPDPTDLPVPSGRPGKPGSPGTSGPATSGSARLTLTGIPQPGVEAGCLLLQGYLLVGGPRDLLGKGTEITVTGRVQRDMLTTCQQGTPFVVESAEPA